MDKKIALLALLMLAANWRICPKRLPQQAAMIMANGDPFRHRTSDWKQSVQVRRHSAHSRRECLGFS
ncbi:MAG TPA: hypothetical protein VKL19_08110 [Thermoanaerobaculia bacterium]|nr:hypothetical protein [Thermoanaerobaculia bacterium]